MIRKVFALILLMTLAFSAVATPHGAMAAPEAEPMAAMQHHGAGHHQQGMPASEHDAGHVCIGCIAPISQIPFGFIAPALLGPDQPRWIAHALPSRHSGPETPPPRTT